MIMIFKEVTYWGMWLIIPLLFEILISFVSYVALWLYTFKKKKEVNMDYKPLVTILIPVYNSSKTLEGCIESVANQTYGRRHMEVFLLNNGKIDESYEIYKRMNMKYSDMNMWWLNTAKGKAKALNEGIYKSSGQYIINIDSDGAMHVDGVKNLIEQFMREPDVHALTGVILIEPKYIEETKGFLKKILRKTELLEYGEAFLLGRNFDSLTGSIYTLAGACSAFRREVLQKTYMYNSETVGEDTHMTFQIKHNVPNGKVKLCRNCLFFVDPIDSVNHLYTQRQRWQRGQLEVGKLYIEEHMATKKKRNFFHLPARELIFSHTLAFPRFVWMAGTVYMYIEGYPLYLLVVTNVLMYIIYSFSSLIGLQVCLKYLKDFTYIRDYMRKNWWAVFFLPTMRFMTYLFRLSGIINSRSREATWTTLNLSQEKQVVVDVLRKYYKTYVEVIINKLGELVKK